MDHASGDSARRDWLLSRVDRAVVEALVGVLQTSFAIGSSRRAPAGP